MKTLETCILITAFTCITLPAAESPDIGGLQVFPPDNPWNWDISSHAVHPLSDHYIESMGGSGHLHPDFGTVWEGAPIGIPYVVVHAGEPPMPVAYTAYGDESDPGPFPIPLDAAVEGGADSDGDRHVIAVDADHAMLYELYRAFPSEGGWEAESGACWDLTSNAVRPEGWTSADAAGLPIFPGLVRYEEVYIRKQITHAIRFTAERTQRAYIWPARHFASSSTDPDLPPMGLRFRLKAGFDISGFSEPVQVILLALKKHGMIVADNGSDWFLSGAPDDRWDDELLGELKSVAGSNFEAVLTVDANGDPIYPAGTSARSAQDKGTSCRIGCYPNPFNASALIPYEIPEACDVSIRLYSLDGREVACFHERHRQAGLHQVKWIPAGCASGIYIYRFQAGRTALSGKILYQK